MIKKIISLVLIFSGFAKTSVGHVYKDDFIQYEAVNLTAEDKLLLKEVIGKLHDRYDPQQQMLTRTLNAWNYHTDAQTGTFHEVRSSFNYAVGLLDVGEEQYRQRAFDLIHKTITLQDTISGSKTCGVWPYYMEEPLATKKSPADWNWADFNAVSLLDVYMGHYDKLPVELKAEIRTSLIYAARSIQKRDVQPNYTNIAIMGTYVTYVISHLFDIPEMKVYAYARLKKFYNYTLERGFTEYNSPTYTIVALDELDRMKRHIVASEAKTMIDSLYNTAWDIIARHYHKPSAQWAGPHSRSYSSLLQSNVNGLLKQASDGKIDPPGATPRSDVKIKHKIPAYLMPYFLNPQFPRTQLDQLTTNDPKVIGTTYLTSRYALSSANRSSLWNQRRPFLAYWGTPEKPSYLQVRFLHDDYDFSASAFYSAQKENDILAGINFMTNAGDKHINIDKLQAGKFKAKDLRLRFEFGNLPPEKLVVPGADHDAFTISSNGLKFNIQLFTSIFGHNKGHWEKGGNEKVSWIDYVIYSGAETDFDLSAINEAVLGFTFNLTDGKTKVKTQKAIVSKDNENLNAKWKGLSVTLPVKPGKQPGNL
ncbi:hypothetical protein [Dyadobacter psychrotolerans]|uniref:Heparinase n=1 Tax=Dyadobacter psychrotolerans TaxID=2541721 RepID=A0A4R5DMD2_9BACT|nr:hypothetical protein [Dyadobacter psychrotolerans]TDE15436.1 hypothetical protein E0F88_13060 [Dyadobacter psychrotolerans]